MVTAAEQVAEVTLHLIARRVDDQLVLRRLRDPALHLLPTLDEKIQSSRLVMTWQLKRGVATREPIYEHKKLILLNT